MEVSSLGIEKYNHLCLHYNLIARSCYSCRLNMAHALSDDFFPYIISALIVFDMQRQMGRGLKQKYDKNENGFATRLGNVITRNRTIFFELESQSIDTIDLRQHKKSISTLYDNFALKGNLDNQDHAFDVGATKILHFIHPSLFPIIDSNSAGVLRDEFDIDYNNTGSPGYSYQRYINSMKEIQCFVNRHGKESLQSLDPVSPITRIFDKLAFVEGAGL